MPTALPLPALRRQLQELLTEDLAAALAALKELLPEATDKHTEVLALQARLKDANKGRMFNTLSTDDYQRRVDTVRYDCFTLIGALTEADLLPAIAPVTAGSAARYGSVLYQVPHQMPIRKPSICKVRVALDADALLDDIVLDDDVRLRERVQVSDMMSAELLDPEGDVFKIRPLSDAKQWVKPDGYTQWLFGVTPLVEGEHQLLVKVSMLEYDQRLGQYIPREVSILETVTIVTEAEMPAEAAEAPLKSTGERLSLSTQPPLPGRGGVSATGEPNAPLSSSKNEVLQDAKDITAPLPSGEGRGRGLRAVAFFLAFLVISSGATYALTPPATLEWWKIRVLEDSPQAYQAFIAKPENSPHRAKAVARLKVLETRRLEVIRSEPTVVNVRQFLVDFPTSERLSEVKQMVETRQELRAELLPALETAYVEAVRQNPSAGTVRQFLADWKDSRRVAEVAQATAAQPEVLAELQPELEQVIVQQVEQAGSAAEVQAMLPALERVGTNAGMAKVEQAVSTKTFRREVQAQMQETRRQVQQREATQSQTPLTSREGMAPEEVRDWAAAEAANTARAYVDFVNKYPKSPQLPVARSRIYALKPALSLQEQDWTDAGLANTPEAYIYFVQKYPGSAHAAEARSRIRGFSLSILERKRLDEQAAARLLAERKAATSPLPIGGGVGGGVDSDGDGIPDKDDKCPDKKGTAANDGCPSKKDLLFEKSSPAPPADKTAILAALSTSMVRVQGGSFTMGSPTTEEGRHEDECEHPVTVGTFYISKYEVTQQQWEAVMGANPSKHKGCPQCPVEYVSWDDVQDFLQKLNAATGKNYRLPTEAEWEYAVRGGAKSKGYQYAGSNSLGSVAWYTSNSGDETHPVGGKAPNELGLYDMSGNVYEWCQDKYKAYPNCEASYSEGILRVYRGGGCFNAARGCRSAYRGANPPGGRYVYLGFRLVSLSLQ